MQAPRRAIKLSLPAMMAMALICVAQPSFAESYVYQYDEYSWDLNTAAMQITSDQLAIQAGFAAAEAFGQHYKPEPEHYPIRILGLDLILAMPPNGGSSEAHADIEIWLDDNLDGATPLATEPAFTIHTGDLYNTAEAEMGTPLMGGVATAINFDWDDPSGHPPIVYGGGIRVVVRFTQAAQDLQTEWNSIECMQFEGLTCGCQEVGVLFDSSITPKANLLNYLTPMGACESGSNAWSYVEDLGISGDIIMRLRADVADVADDGDTGTGDTGSTDDGGDSTDETPDDTPDEAMSVAAISPGWGSNDAATAVTITGGGFAADATVTLGSTDLGEVEVVGDGLIRASVPSGIEPGVYMLVVANADGDSAFLVDAFEVTAGETPDEGTDDTTEPEPEVSDEDPSAGDPAEEGCAGTVPPMYMMFIGLWAFMHARRRAAQRGVG